MLMRSVIFKACNRISHHWHLTVFSSLPNIVAINSFILFDHDTRTNMLRNNFINSTCQYRSTLQHTVPNGAVWYESGYHCECVRMMHARSWSDIDGMCGTEQIEVIIGYLDLNNMFLWWLRELESTYSSQEMKIQNTDFFKNWRTNGSLLNYISIVSRSCPPNTVYFLWKLWPFFNTSATFFHNKFLLALQWTSSLNISSFTPS